MCEDQTVHLERTELPTLAVGSMENNRSRQRHNLSVGFRHHRTRSLTNTRVAEYIQNDGGHLLTHDGTKKKGRAVRRGPPEWISLLNYADGR